MKSFRARFGRAFFVLLLVGGMLAGAAATSVVAESAGAMGFDDTLERSGTPDLGSGGSTVDINSGYDPQTRFRVFVNNQNVANGVSVSPGDIVTVQYDIGDNSNNAGSFTDLNFLPISGTKGERLYGESAGDLGNGNFTADIVSTRTGVAATGGSVFRLTNVQQSRWGDNDTCGANSRTDRALNDVDSDITSGDVAPVAAVGNTQMSFATSGSTNYKFRWANISSSSCVAVDEYWDGFTARMEYTVQPCVTPAEATWHMGGLSLTDGATMNWPANDPTELQLFSLKMDCPPKPPVCTDYIGSSSSGGPAVTFSDLLMQHGTAGVLDVGQLHNAYDPDYNPDFYPGGPSPDTPELRVTWISPTSTQGGTVSSPVLSPAFPSDPGGGANVPTSTAEALTYTPPALLSGTDYVYYQITDQAGIHAMCRVVIQTPPVPVAGADSATVDAWYGTLNTPASTGGDVDTTIDLLSNDTDPAGGVLTASLSGTTSANGGTLVDNGDGTVSYTPAEGFCGDDAFSYTLEAVGPAPDTTVRSSTGYVSITVLCNEAPVAIDDSVNVLQGGSVSGSVRANDLDFEDPTAGFVYSIVTPPANAAAFTLNADGSFTYQHDGSTSPTSDTFVYQVCDMHETIQPPSDPAMLPRCVEATAIINVTLAPQAPPIAVADAGAVDSYYSSDGQAATSVTIDVAVNDSDPDGNLDPTSVNVLSGPTAAQGLLTNNGDGTLSFAPADGYSGPVTVVYEICDDPAAAVPPATAALCANAVLLINVVGNLAPIAITDSTTVAQDSVAGDMGNLITVLLNDFDPGGELIVVSAADAMSVNGGTVTVNADGTITYVPAAGYSGADSFTYTLCDSHDAAADSTAVMAGDPWTRCTTGTVNVDVTATANQPPVAITDFSSTDEDTPVDVDLLANDSDNEDTPGGIPLTVTFVSATSLMGGTVVDNGDGTVTYTPAAGFCGLDAFNYGIEDSGGLAAATNVLVNVACDEPPVAEDDSLNTAFNTVGTVVLLDNDTDAEDGAPTVSSVEATSVEGGTVVDNGDGTATYTPTAGFCGLDTFDYVVTDTKGQIDTATVSVNVTCANADQDGDGIPDWVEIIICGTATCADGTEDADGNGIPDWTEIIICGSAGCVSTSDDTDGDGIPDWVEIIICGTSTCATGAEDSDGDGIPDWVEILLCGTATCAEPDTDSDGDGIPDWIEIIICGTATCADGTEDSDGDGVPDWIEIILCGSVSCAEPEDDSDGDGIPDWVEVIVCGTATCLDPSTDTDGDGIPDWIEVIICGTATCADGTEDTDGNGIPDWQEIGVCGEAGCLPNFLKAKPVGSCSNTATFDIPGTLEYDIPNGFRSNTDITIYMYSDPVKLYSGVLPVSGKVTLNIPAGTLPGKHKFMVIGVDDITGAVKIDGCARNGVLPKTTVAGATQAPATGAKTAVTGVNSGLVAAAAGGLVAIGLALFLLGRRRRSE